MSFKSFEKGCAPSGTTGNRQISCNVYKQSVVVLCNLYIVIVYISICTVFWKKKTRLNPKHHITRTQDDAVNKLFLVDETVNKTKPKQEPGDTR